MIVQDMLLNIKGEDTSALKKFAYTVFAIENNYHGKRLFRLYSDI